MTREKSITNITFDLRSFHPLDNMRVTQIAIYFVIENKFWTQDIQLYFNEEDV